MTQYIATNYVSPAYGTVAEAAAAIEAKVETPLDSTTQAVWLWKIVQMFDEKFKAVIIYKDTA